MIIIGLTGSIGMGKSGAARMFRRMNIPVHDSDAAVHAAMAPDGAAFQAIRENFPEAYDNGRHAIDRQKLGAVIFKDPKARKRLEAILHPHVRISQQNFLKGVRSKGGKLAVLEIPLLFETGAEARVDVVVTVTAPYAIQKRRVLSRKNMSEEKFKHILASQIPDRQKKWMSDYVVQTGMGYAATYASLRKIVKELQGF